MGRIIAVANQKGGVGKTTTAVNTAAALAAMQHRVLLVDLDPQGNATTGSGIDKRGLDHSTLDALMGERPVGDCVRRCDPAGYDILPANGDLTAAEVRLVDAPLREKRLQLALDSVVDDYAYVFIDCPPSLNMLTLNALVAAHSVLVPLQTEYYALEGLSALLATVQQIREHRNPRLEMEGIVRTMHDPRNNLDTQVSAQLIQHFGDKVFRTMIPRNVRVAEAPSHGLPVLLYDKNSRGAMSYVALASEIARRVPSRPEERQTDHG
jgi:chromosome partitioning protein